MHRRTVLAASLLSAVAIPATSHADQAATVQRALSSVVTIITDGGEGSGFAYRNSGTILSNAHVVEGADQVTVVLPDGSRILGRVVERNSDQDLATIAIDRPLTPLRARGAKARAGEEVFALGAPLGLSGSVSKGIVSAVDRDTPQGPAIQTDVAINPGNSGGPLIDTTGAVLGVTTSQLSDAQGIGFAVPISAATDIPDGSARASGSASKEGGFPWFLGAALAVLTGLAVTLALSARRSRPRGNAEPIPVPVTLRSTPQVGEADAPVEITLRHDPSDGSDSAEDRRDGP